MSLLAAHVYASSRVALLLAVSEHCLGALPRIVAVVSIDGHSLAGREKMSREEYMCIAA